MQMGCQCIWKKVRIQNFCSGFGNNFRIQKICVHTVQGNLIYVTFSQKLKFAHSTPKLVAVAVM